MVTNTRRCHVVFALTASLLAPVQAQDKALNTPMGFQTEVTAKMRGATVSFDYGNGNPERIRSLLKAVLVTKPDGPALTIIDDRAFHDEACDRANAGLEGDDVSCVLGIRNIQNAYQVSGHIVVMGHESKIMGVGKDDTTLEHIDDVILRH